MPRRERQKELARRRQRREKRRKLKAKGLLAQSAEGLKENTKKTSEMAPPAEVREEETKGPLSEG
jgi:hypothetical protein